MRRGIGLLVLGLWVCTSSQAEDDPLAAGKTIVERECQSCHGPDGRSERERVPSIGGFSATAILDLIESYKLDARPANKMRLEDGSTNHMKAVIKQVTDEDMRLAAQYYASVDWRPHEQAFDKVKARQGSRIHAVKCGKCHLREGSIAASDHALLSGQWRTYLEMQFEDFDQKNRRMVSKMQQKYDSLSAADKAALIELYVSAGAY